MSAEWIRSKPGRSAFASQLELEAIIRTRAYPVAQTRTILGACLTESVQEQRKVPELDMAAEEFKFLDELVQSGAVDLDDDEHIETLALARRHGWFSCMWDEKERWREVHVLRDYLVEIGRLPSGAGFDDLRALMELRA